MCKKTCDLSIVIIKFPLILIKFEFKPQEKISWAEVKFNLIN
jgi:hypothetical protein